VRELVDYAKAHPGKVNFASGGVGTLPHLTYELLRLEAGIHAIHVPYAGGAPATTALIAGQADVLFDLVRTRVKSGEVRALAITGDTRDPELADVPTIAEAGVPGYAVDVWYAMLAPSGVPRPTLERINQAVAKILHSPDVTKKLASMGLEPVGENLAATDAYIKSEIRKWARVVEAAKITAD
jgi:tripartite-type tricarboxylate transporter receptor subunit TctC